MKFTYLWLKEHLETSLAPEEILDTLTSIGLEVETTTSPPRLDGLLVGRIKETAAHPHADRLVVCQVETARGVHQVVCGAPNAEVGFVGVFAPPGVVLPGGMRLRVVRIREVESRGMLCSAAELGVGEDHETLLALPGTTSVGSCVSALLGGDDGMTIEIAITPNRGDCLGVRGIARDLAAAGCGRLKPLRSVALRARGPVGVPVRLEGTGCAFFACRRVRGVTNGSSPGWMQGRLRAIGARPINTLVDITNYVLVDCGQPLHVYDAATIRGALVARPGRTRESLRALDGRTYAAHRAACVIADEEKLLGLGGLMGGVQSGATLKTRDVIVESAFFDPQQTALTGRTLGLESPSRFRFERGVDPQGVVRALDLAAHWVQQLCGGEVSARHQVGRLPSASPAIAYRPGSFSRLTGHTLGAARQQKYLTALGFRIQKKKTLWRVGPPSWRRDLEGEADVVEELLRLWGVNKVAAVPLPQGDRRTLSPLAVRERLLRHGLAARGCLEAVTWSFISARAAALFCEDPKTLWRVSNPLSSQLEVMRPSVVPGLVMAAVRLQARAQRDVALFEVGRRYQRPKEIPALAGLRCGHALFSGGYRSWGTPPRALTALDAKADAVAALRACGVEALDTLSRAPPWYAPGNSGSLVLDKSQNILAHFGLLHPKVGAALDVEGPMAIFEIHPQALPLGHSSKGSFESRTLHPVRRDFAFVVGTDVTAQDLLKTIGRAAQDHEKALEMHLKTRLFDVFPLSGGARSLGVEICVWQRRILTGEEIEALSAHIVQRVKTELGASLRG